jgi:hypothetical protein
MLENSRILIEGRVAPHLCVVLNPATKAASHLTPADLAREQARARKWFEDHPAKPQ